MCRITMKILINIFCLLVLSSILFAQNTDLNTQLLEACEAGNYEQARLLIEQGADVNATDEYGRTPLHGAARNENGFEIAKFLIEKGADVNTNDKWGSTPLHLAATNKSGLEIARLLIENGADLNAKDEYYGYTPLHYACENSNGLNTVILLIEKGAKIDAVDEYGLKYIHRAATNTNGLEMLKYLIAKGVDLHSKTIYGMSVLHYAAYENTNPEIIKYLLESGFNVNGKTMDGSTPLHFAAENENGFETAKLLIKQGADVNSKDKYGNLPLHFAAQNENGFDVCKILIENGSYVNKKNHDGNTPLHLVVLSKDFDKVCDLMLKNGANPRIKNKEKISADFYFNEWNTITYINACVAGDLEKVKELLANGMNVNNTIEYQYKEDKFYDIYEYEYGLSGLQIAFLQSDTVLFNFLIENHADLNDVLPAEDDELNVNLLYLSILLNNEYFFNVLIDNGADINYGFWTSEFPESEYIDDNKYYFPTNTWISPLSLAFMNGNNCMIKELILRVADVNIDVTQEITNVFANDTTQYEALSEASRIIDQSDYNIYNEYEYYSPLEIAILLGDDELAKLLIDKGAFVCNTKQTEDYNVGHTPLELTLILNNKPLFYYCLEKGVDVKLNLKYNLASFYDLQYAANKNELFFENYLPIDRFDIREGIGTLLHYAIIKKDIGLVDTLLASGANPKVQLELENLYFETLNLAILKNNTEIVKRIINSKAQVNKSDFLGNNCMHYACMQNNLDMCKLLLSHCKNINLINIYGMTPLDIAASNQNATKIVGYLIEKGADYNLKNINGKTALHFVAENEGGFETAKLLVEKGAEVNAKVSDKSESHSGYTPLHFAAENANGFDIAKLLIEYGADVNAIDVDTITPLHLAAKCNQPNTAALLISNNANKDIVNSKGVSAAHMAKNFSNFDVYQLLTNPDYRLFGFYWLKDIKGLQNLLVSSPELALLTDKYGQTVWHNAVTDDYSEVLQLLFSEKSIINAQNQQGQTILLYAIYKNKTQTAIDLIHNGADVNQADNKGFTPYILSKNLGNTLIVDELIRFGADTTFMIKPQLCIQKGYTRSVESVTYSSNGKVLALMNWTTIKLWTIQNGTLLRIFRRDNKCQFEKRIFSPDGNTLVSCCDGFSDSQNVKLFDVKSGDLIRDIQIKNYGMPIVSYSADGKTLATEEGVEETTIINFWDTRTGLLLKSWEANVDNICSIAFSLDGKTLAIGSFDNLINLYDIQTGKLLRSIKSRTDIGDLSFLKDGVTLVSEDYFFKDITTLKLWDVQSGSLINTFNVKYLSFSDNGKVFVSWGNDLTIKLWGIQSGKLMKTYEGHGQQVNSVVFSSDNKAIVSGSSDKTVKLWDIATGNAVTFFGHKEPVINAQFMEDTTKIVSVDESGVIIYWDIATQKQLAAIYPINDSLSVVVTPEGYFDGTPEALKYLHYVQGMEIIPLEAYYEQFYRPNLLQRILRGESIEQSRIDFNKRKPNAGVKILEPGSGNSRGAVMVQSSQANRLTVKAEFTDNGGGISEVRVYRNDKLVHSEAVGYDKPGTSIQRQFILDLNPGINTITVSVFNNDRTEIADTVKMNFTGFIAETPNLYVVAVGINDYVNPQYRLNYAVNDAEAFAANLKAGSASLYGKVENHLIVNGNATKENIAKTIAQVQAKAKPWDVFVFYYAGHGIAINENGNTQFYLVSADVTNIFSSDQLKSLAISNSELLAYSRDIPSDKQFIVIDACNSGAAANMLSYRSGPEEQRALAVLARSTGTHFLFASTADQLAKEIPQIGHGVFTYAILQAMSGGDGYFKSDAGVSVKDISNYTERKVPDISQTYIPGGVPQYPTAYSYGQDFPLVLASQAPGIKKLKGKYDDYTIDELQEMKVKAATDEDYKKADEIKMEIEKRKSAQ
jgi:ankyrin repeat protein